MGPGISSIAIETPWPVGPVRAYVIDDDPLTLVDTGQRSPSALAAVEAGLAALGRRVEDVGRISLTHQHTKLKGELSERNAFFVLCDVLGHLDELIDAGAAAEDVDAGGVSRFARA